MVYIDHNDGMTTVLAHLDQTIINDGQWVTKEQVIGYSGRSGFGQLNYYAPHLHWAMKVTGHPGGDPHMEDGYAAELDPIPGVFQEYNPDRVCGTP